MRQNWSQVFLTWSGVGCLTSYSTNMSSWNCGTAYWSWIKIFLYNLPWILTLVQTPLGHLSNCWGLYKLDAKAYNFLQKRIWLYVKLISMLVNKVLLDTRFFSSDHSLLTLFCSLIKEKSAQSEHQRGIPSKHTKHRRKMWRDTNYLFHLVSANCKDLRWLL